MFYLNLVLVGMAAFLLAHSTLVQTGSQFNFFSSPAAAFSGFATLTVYLLMRSRLLYVHPGEQKTVLNVKLVSIALSLLFFSTIGFFLHLTFWQQLLTVPLVFTSFAYFLPVFNAKRLRDFLPLKHLTVGLMWAMATVVLPLADDFTSATLILFFERLFFVASLSMLFDHRDIQLDEAENHSTIVRQKGWRVSKMMSILLILSSGVCAIFYSYDWMKLFAISLSLILILLTNTRKNNTWYNILLEAMMIVYALSSLV